MIIISCKSTKSTVDNKLDITHTKIDQSTKVIDLSKTEFNLDEITIVSADPKIETVITDNKGNTKTFKNVKSITIKKQKESKQTNLVEEKKDVKDVLIDKSEIEEKKESTSDAVQWKWIMISLAVVSICAVAWKFS